MARAHRLPEGLPLAAALAITHVVAAYLFVRHAVAPGRHRRSAPFWLLVVYWLGVAAFLVPLATADDPRRVAPTLPSIGLWTCVVVAVAIPVVHVARRVRRR